jgi:hypothetical protein
MKNILALFFSFFIFSSFAQERNPDFAKELPPRTENECAGFAFSRFDGVNITESTIIETILGPDIQSYNMLNFQATSGNNASAGLFSGGIAAGIGLESGIVLSTGFITNVTGPNEYAGITGVLDLPGDTDLNALIPGYSTFEATILEFEFVPLFDTLYISFVFGSEEYNEWVGSPYNDVFGFFLNGQNIALVPGTGDRISINNINNNNNSEYFIDNDQRPGPFCNEMDGYTILMTAMGVVTPGETQTIKLAIADAGDRSFDSWVFIGTEGFSGIDPDDPDDPTDPDDPEDPGDNEPHPLPLGNWPIILVMLLIIAFTFFKFRKQS